MKHRHRITTLPAQPIAPPFSTQIVKRKHCLYYGSRLLATFSTRRQLLSYWEETDWSDLKLSKTA